MDRAILTALSEVGHEAEDVGLAREGATRTEIKNGDCWAPQKRVVSEASFRGDARRARRRRALHRSPCLRDVRRTRHALPERVPALSRRCPARRGWPRDEVADTTRFCDVQ